MNFVTAHDGFTLERPRQLQREAQRGERRGQQGRHLGQSFLELRRGEADRRPGSQRASPAPDAQHDGHASAFAGHAYAAGWRRIRPHTQLGNNNAYCQDNEISWLNWQINDTGKALTRFVQKLTMLRCTYPILRGRRFLTGKFGGRGAIREVSWMNPAGTQIAEENWADPGMHCFGMLLDGRAAPNGNGEAAALLLVMNSHFEDVPFTLPEAAFGMDWSLLIDTNVPESISQPKFKIGDAYDVTARSFLLLLLETSLQEDRINSPDI